MKTDDEIRQLVRSLDLPLSNINEAKYQAMIKAHSFCGIGIDKCTKRIADIAADEVENMANG